MCNGTERWTNGNIPDDWFKPKGKDSDKAESVVRPSLSYWKDAWRRLRKNKLAMGGLIFLIVLTLFAIFAPMLSPHSVTGTDYPNQNKAPSAEHWFGTDETGRDVFTRTWYGARISLFVGVMAALIDFFIGIIYGGISGYKGGRTDTMMMRIIEILYGLPHLLVVILLMVVMGPSLTTIIVALTITGWVGMARIVRGQVLQIKNYEFVTASKSFGAKTPTDHPEKLVAKYNGSNHRPDDIDRSKCNFCRGVPKLSWGLAFKRRLRAGGSWRMMHCRLFYRVIGGDCSSRHFSFQ